MSFLVDTNIISELRKGNRCNPGVRSWVGGTLPDSLFVSVLTLGEIVKGIQRIRRRDTRAATSLQDWLDGVVAEYADRILIVDHAVAEEWGRLNADDPLPTIDSLLAATVIVHSMTLVTRNVRDFARTGVPCINPFD